MKPNEISLSIIMTLSGAERDDMIQSPDLHTRNSDLMKVRKTAWYFVMHISISCELSSGRVSHNHDFCLLFIEDEECKQ